jgi:hypothetical protein
MDLRSDENSRFFRNLQVRNGLAVRRDTNPPNSACPVCHCLDNNGDSGDLNVEMDKVLQQAALGCAGCVVLKTASDIASREDTKWMWPRDDDLNRTAKVDLHASTVRFSSGNQCAIFTPSGNDIRFDGINEVKRKSLPMDYSGSPEAVALIQSWVNECCHTHNDCRIRTGDGSSLQDPTRVLDLDCPEGIRLRNAGDFLVEKASMPLDSRYCALSHCWGTGSLRPLTTTNDTLESRMKKIEHSHLSKTFQDAVHLTRALGIRYLWIDSLCIVQDNLEDWSKESSKMSSVYEQAFLVISATAAAHGGIGCYINRIKEDFGTLCFTHKPENGSSIDIYVRKTGLRDSGQGSSNLHFEPSALYNAQQSPLYPLLSRSWCLQERFLATRTIHFAGSDLVFECIEQTYSERKKFNTYAMKLSIRHKWGVSRKKIELYDIWHKTLKLYMDLDISMPSDRLPAMSGLAKRMQSRGTGEYVAGIFVENGFAELFWKASSPKSRALEWRAPSWSWACLGDRPSLYHLQQSDNSDEAILDSAKLRLRPHYLGRHEPDPFTAKLLRWGQELASADSCGMVKSAFLVISAPVVSVSVPPGKSRYAQTVEKDGLELPFNLDDGADVNTGPFWLVWIGSVWKNYNLPVPMLCLLLVRESKGICGRAAEPGAFERIGAARTERYDAKKSTEHHEMVSKWFEDGKIQEMKLI